MLNKPNRYSEMERYLTYALLADAVLFILYLIFAGVGVVWLKIVLAVLGFILSGLLLWYLYTTKELLKRRSLWISTGAAAIAVCLLFSLILNFPSPNKYKPKTEEKSSYSVSEFYM